MNVDRAALRRDIEELEFPGVRADLQARAEEAEARARELGDWSLVHRARLAQADALLRVGRTSTGGRIAREVSRVVEAGDDNYVRARCAVVLSRFFRYLGDRQAVLEHAVRGLELLPEDAHALVRYDHELMLGIAFATMGSFDSARRQLYRVRQLVEGLGQDELLPSVYNNSAYVEYMAGDYPAALKLAERMRETVASSGRAMQPTWVDTIGRIYHANGMFAEAKAVLETVDDPEVLAQQADADALAMCLLSLTQVHRALGDGDAAVSVLSRCLDLCKEQALHQVHAEAQREMAALLAAQGMYKEAYERHLQFHEEWARVSADERDAHARIIQAVYETTEAREESERYRELSMHDPLTSLANRRYVSERLPALLGEGNRESLPLAVALVDVDHFKRVNDTCSHEVGDLVLVALGRLFPEHVPDGFAARMGGEEFLLVMPATGEEAALRRCEGVRRAIAEHDWSAVTGDLPVTVSIGVAVSGTERNLPDQLLRAADSALYAAKRDGRNRVVGADA